MPVKFFASREDIPMRLKPKTVIFYACGLKVYGQIPYILARRLRAQFYSNDMVSGMGRLIAASAEPNYTVVPYQQSTETFNALMEWLISDAGFQCAVAAPECFHDKIENWNAWNSPPHTFVPGEIDGFKRKFVLEAK